MHHVRGIEGEDLLHVKAVIGIGKSKRGGSIQSARSRRHIQRLHQLVAQVGIVGPERERIPNLGRCLRVDQVQRLTRVVFVLLQNPGDSLAAAIGKGDAVQLVLHHRSGFGGSNHCIGSRIGRRSRPVHGRSRGNRRLGRGTRSHLGRSLRLRLFLWPKVLQAKEDQNKDDGEDEERAGVLPTATRLIRIANFGQREFLSIERSGGSKWQTRLEPPSYGKWRGSSVRKRRWGWGCGGAAMGIGAWNRIKTSPAERVAAQHAP